MKNLRGIVAICVALWAVPSFSAVDAFIWFENVQGESKEPAHNGWIEVSSFSWGASRAAGIGKPVSAQGCGTNEIHFTAGDKSGPTLVKLAIHGTHFSQPVKLDIGGQRHILDNASISSCQNNLATTHTVNCTMMFSRCETHAAAVSTASMINRNAPTTQPNGQLLLGTDAETLTVLGAAQQGNSVVLRVRGGSSSLMQKCATGKHYDRVTISCRKAGGTQQAEYFKVTMSDVLISSFSITGDGSASIGMRFGMADGSFAGFQDIH